MDTLESGASLNVRRLRGILAERHITQTQLAQTSGLSTRYVCRILNDFPPGELAVIKLKRGLRQLGIESELARAS